MIDFAALLDQIDHFEEELGKFPSRPRSEVPEKVHISQFSQFPNKKQDLYSGLRTHKHARSPTHTDEISRVKIADVGGKLGTPGKESGINSLSSSLLGNKKEELGNWESVPAGGLVSPQACPTPAPTILATFDSADLPPLTEVQSWREGFAVLNRNREPCSGFRGSEWFRIHVVIEHFLKFHADEAHRLGWTALDLFAVHETVGVTRVDACGALMVSAGALVDRVEQEIIHFSQDGRPRGRFFRRPLLHPEAVLVWGYGSGASL